MLNQLQPEKVPIPEEIRQLAARQNVGMPLKSYQTKQALKITALSLMLIFLFVIGVGLWLSLQEANILKGLFFGLFFLCLLLLALFGIHREIYSPIYLCSQGLLSICGKQHQVIRWSEIQGTSYRYTASYGGSAGLVLRGMDGKKFVLSRNLNQYEELYAIIEGQVKETMVAAALTQYEHGETIHFGDLEVNQSGIADRDNAIIWEQLEDVRLVKSELSLRYDGEWHDWHGPSSWKIYAPHYSYPPNLPVFVALVQHILARKNGVV